MSYFQIRWRFWSWMNRTMFKLGIVTKTRWRILSRLSKVLRLDREGP